MDYLEWNALIAKCIFNEENAGKNIYLYLSKEDIIEIGKSIILTPNNDIIWKDFVCAIKESLFDFEYGNPIIEKAKILHEEWVNQNNNIFDQKTYLYPPYIVYLVLTVLPLTEAHESFDPRNYYDPLKEFLKDIDLPIQNIDTQNFKYLDVLWEDLFDWANNKKGGTLGVFQLHNFGNPNWVHVGKPLSQSLLSPNTLLKLPNLFNEARLTPYSNYSDEYFRQIVVYHNKSILTLKDFVYKILKDKKDTEIIKAIIGIIKKEFHKWNGETERKIVTEHSEKTAKGFTVAKICLQLEINYDDEKLKISNRLLSKNEYPENLTFDNLQIAYEINGYSKTAFFDLESSSEFTDENNKWIARFPNSDIHLFVNAGYYQLSSSYYIETENLSIVNPMFLLCRSDLCDEIIKWGSSFNTGDFKKVEFDGVPDDLSLFWFKNPTCSNSQFEELKLFYNKSLEIKGGIKIKGRAYLPIHPPYVDIKNSDGKETLYMEYINDGSLCNLLKDETFLDRFHFPPNIKTNIPFKIKIKDQELSSDIYLFEFVKIFLSDLVNYKYDIPSRDKFGFRTNNNGANIVKGNSLLNKEYLDKQKFYLKLFKENYQLGINIKTLRKRQKYSFHDDSLLYFLSTKKDCSINDFYDVFEYLYNIYSKSEKTFENLHNAKKNSLYYYSYLGFIECYYDTREIHVCPPQMFLIPTKYGRKAILTGAREKDLIEKLISVAKERNISFNFKKHSDIKNEFLLPNIITLHSVSNDSRIDENNLIKLSKDCNIPLNNNEFIQIGFLLTSSSVDEYRNYVLQNLETDKEDYQWGRYIFNPDKLSFQPNSNSDFNKNLSLVEYRLDFKLNQKLWLSNRCYKIDKNWGRFLVLKRMGKNIILYDGQTEILAIPTSIPLPLLLAKSIIMLSGEIPERIYIQTGKNGFFYYIFKNIPELIAKQLSNVKLGQEIIIQNLNQ